jgi:hypothetical protein
MAKLPSSATGWRPLSQQAKQDLEVEYIPKRIVELGIACAMKNAILFWWTIACLGLSERSDRHVRQSLPSRSFFLAAMSPLKKGKYLFQITKTVYSF